jgi:RNA polymerase sigma-70 factor (ECF subfamily)
MHNSTPIGEVAVAKRKPGTESIEGISLDRANFSILYRQYATRVYRYVIARVRDQADAEDITAQVFMDALQQIDRLQPGTNFTAWIFTLARNKIVDRHRHARRRLSLDEIPDLPAQTEPLSTNIEQQQIFSQLSGLLQGLDPDQQELLRLRFAGELTFSQIAQVLGKSEAAVKMSTYRLLRQLQEKMEQGNG